MNDVKKVAVKRHFVTMTQIFLYASTMKVAFFASYSICLNGFVLCLSPLFWPYLAKISGAGSSRVYIRIFTLEKVYQKGFIAKKESRLFLAQIFEALTFPLEEPYNKHLFVVSSLEEGGTRFTALFRKVLLKFLGLKMDDKIDCAIFSSQLHATSYILVFYGLFIDANQMNCLFEPFIFMSSQASILKNLNPWSKPSI